MKRPIDFTFTKGDFYWRDQEKQSVAQTVTILNTLTPEQKQAVRTYGYSRYDVGYSDGHESGYEEALEK